MSVLKLVEKQAKASGILKRVCCHSFRATGVTEYMNAGDTIEIAQRVAGHTSPSTTRIYDRRMSPPASSPGFAVSNQKGESERFLALNTRHLRREKFC